MGSHHYTNGHETAGHLRAARYSGTMSTAHTKPLSELIDPGWAHALAGVEPQIHAMGAFIRQQQAQGKRILPASGNILRAFTIPFDSVKVLIVGQDPYPRPGTRSD